MPCIRFFVEDVHFNLNQKQIIRHWIKNTIREEGFFLSELNYIFCSDKHLLSINQDFLQHDTLTDIITFDFSENTSTIEGEIYISIERIKENALNLNIPLQKEINRVIIHGVLHLCGYGDKSRQEKKKMIQKEDYYLEKLDSR